MLLNMNYRSRRVLAVVMVLAALWVSTNPTYRRMNEEARGIIVGIIALF